MSDFSHPTYHTCRKPFLRHVCFLCGLSIEKGEAYARYAHFYDGHASTVLEHVVCRKLFNELSDPKESEYDIFALQEWHPESYGIKYNEWRFAKLYRNFLEDAAELLEPAGWVASDSIWGEKTVWRAPDAKITFGEYGHRTLRHMSRGIEDVVIYINNLAGALRYLDNYRERVLCTHTSAKE